MDDPRTLVARVYFIYSGSDDLTRACSLLHRQQLTLIGSRTIISSLKRTRDWATAAEKAERWIDRSLARSRNPAPLTPRRCLSGARKTETPPPRPPSHFTRKLALANESWVTGPPRCISFPFSHFYPPSFFVIPRFLQGEFWQSYPSVLFGRLPAFKLPSSPACRIFHTEDTWGGSIVSVLDSDTRALDIEGMRFFVGGENDPSCREGPFWWLHGTLSPFSCSSACFPLSTLV